MAKLRLWERREAVVWMGEVMNEPKKCQTKNPGEFFLKRDLLYRLYIQGVQG